MFGQILQLILTESSAQKAAHFIDFSTQVLYIEIAQSLIIWFDFGFNILNTRFMSS